MAADRDMDMDLNGARLFVFDLDGTLVDTFEDITEAVNYSLQRLGFPRLSVDAVRQYVGNGVFQLMQNIFDMFPEGEDFKGGKPPVEKAVGLWREYYLAHPADRARLYPGVMDLLNFLKKKGIKRAILSNKVTVEVLKALEISPLFDYIMGEGGGAPRKPSPEGLLFLMEKFGATAGETWLVGDGEADIRAGLKAGCHVCGVTHGILDRRTLLCLGAHVVVDSLGELMCG
jgi:phosphoglycolate phosphatase